MSVSESLTDARSLIDLHGNVEPGYEGAAATVLAELVAAIDAEEVDEYGNPIDVVELTARVNRLEAWVAHLAPASADLGAMPPTVDDDGNPIAPLHEHLGRPCRCSRFVTVTIPRHIAMLAAEGVVGSNVPEDDVSTFVRRACQAVVS